MLSANEVYAHADDLLDQVETTISEAMSIRNRLKPLKERLGARRIDEDDLYSCVQDLQDLADELRMQGEALQDETELVVRAMYPDDEDEDEDERSGRLFGIL